MKKALTISIIIPVYNEESHLKACLQSIANQSESPDEVIVVDNNSTDRSVEIAHSFPFVRVITEKQQGITPARNAGFNTSKCDLLGRIDADTRLSRDWVRQVRHFYSDTSKHATALTGGCAFYNIPMPKTDAWITSQFVFRMNRFLMGHYVLWGSNMVVPAKVWHIVAKQTCPETPGIHEDLDLAIHLHRQGYDISYQATLVVGARMRRVFEDRDKLWSNLMMWPKTLRAHHITMWPLSLIGAVFLYVSQVVPRTTVWLAKRIGWRPE